EHRDGDRAQLADRRSAVAGSLGNRRLAQRDIPVRGVLIGLDLAARQIEHLVVHAGGRSRRAYLVGAFLVRGGIAREGGEQVPVWPAVHPAVLVLAGLAEAEHHLEVMQRIATEVEVLGQSLDFGPYEG